MKLPGERPCAPLEWSYERSIEDFDRLKHPETHPTPRAAANSLMFLKSGKDFWSAGHQGGKLTGSPGGRFILRRSGRSLYSRPFLP